MLKILIAAASIALGLATGARADDAHKHGDAAKKPPAAQAAPGSGGCNMDMAPMQERMTRMRGQMDKIRATPDPKEKERLMEEHYKSMQQSMSMMQGMMGGGMMHGKKGHGSAPKPAN